MRPVAVINPMKSSRPTGIGIAGDAVFFLLPEGIAVTSARLDRWFVIVNDALIPSALRALLRLCLVQLAPFFFQRGVRLLFTSHHAPLWRTGHHAIILYDTIALRFPAQAPAQTCYYRYGLPRVLRCAERIVVISSAVRDEFALLGYRGVLQATVIPSWSPQIGQRPSAGAAVPRMNHELLVVGARYPHKNLDVVLAALEILNKSAPAPWRLTIAGVDRGLWAKAWGGLAHFEALGWVRVIERVGAAELARLYERSMALVYPSLAEGQGLPPLEAMAAGCPVICSDLPVLRETCGDAALYFTVSDAKALACVLDEMVADHMVQETAQRVAGGQDRLVLYSMATLAERWREFMEAWP